MEMLFFLRRIQEKVVNTVKRTTERQAIISHFIRWTPPLLAGIILFMVPPVGFSILLAYFTYPLLATLYFTFRIPKIIATFLVMIVLASFFYTFLFLAYHSLLDTIPVIEQQLSPYTATTDVGSRVILFVEQKALQFGQQILDIVIAFIQQLFQQLFSLFIFLISLFFALRETVTNRFWFLVYFPKRMQRHAKAFFQETGQLIGTFLGIELRLFILSFVLLTVWFFALDFTSPIGNAFLIALVDSIPFLGIGLFLIPMALFFLYTGQLYTGIALILLYATAMTVRQLAESFMWASTFQLKAVHAFLMTACAIYLFGFVGILLTPFLLFLALKVKNHPLFT